MGDLRIAQWIYLKIRPGFTKRKLKICVFYPVNCENRMDMPIISATKVAHCERIFMRGKRLLRISVLHISEVVCRFQLVTSKSLQKLDLKGLKNGLC